MDITVLLALLSEDLISLQLLVLTSISVMKVNTVIKLTMLLMLLLVALQTVLWEHLCLLLVLKSKEIVFLAMEVMSVDLLLELSLLLLALPDITALMEQLQQLFLLVLLLSLLKLVKLVMNALLTSMLCTNANQDISLLVLLKMLAIFVPLVNSVQFLVLSEMMLKLFLLLIH